MSGVAVRALSLTPFAAELLEGPVAHGVSLGHGHLLISGSVLSLTRPGALRMPNGIESDLPAPESGTPVQVGNGRLVCESGVITAGPLWDPRPVPRFAVSSDPALPLWRLLAIAGGGPGLTPLGDDVAVGCLGARATWVEASRDGEPGDESGHARSRPLHGSAVNSGLGRLAERLAARTTSLSGTLLRLAARGHLPEAAHRLLEHGDPEPLLLWGATSGSGVLVGLGLFCRGCGGTGARPTLVALPLTTPRVFAVTIHAISSTDSSRR